MDTVGEHIELPDSIPFFGSIDDRVLSWVRDNPNEAHSLAVDLRRVLERYEVTNADFLG